MSSSGSYRPGDYHRPPGGGGWLRLFSQGDNPLFWSVPFMRLAGISVRVSIIYIIWMITELVGPGGMEFKLWRIGGLFLMVLLHEYGHCIACRLVKGEADEILMWMLGGLAYCRPPHRWRAALITTIGGPLVNVLLLPVLGVAVLAAGLGTRALWFVPFHVYETGAVLPFSANWQIGVWSLYVSNWALLAFNVLFPMFPLDGARIVQELLWSRLGYTRSMYIATTVGLFTAVATGLYGMATQEFFLLGLAIFGGITCYTQRLRLKFVDDGDDWMDRVERESGARAKQRRKEAARLQAETAELDRVLAKIKEKGMGSLSRSEETFLRRTTRQRQGQ